MKKLIALLLCLSLLVSLAACGRGGQTTETAAFTVPLDDASYVYQAADDAVPLPGGASIALAADAAGIESGPDALLWQGIQTFAANFGYTAQSCLYGEGASLATAEDALRAAAQSGAALVVCRGEAMAKALFNIQANYPNVHYLLFDD